MYGAAKRSVRSFAFLSTFVLVAFLFVPAAFAADLSQTHTMKNGVSFKYPSGWTPMESQQGPVVSVSLVNPTQPTTAITVSVGEGVPADSAPVDEESVKAQLAATGQNIELLAFKKVTLAGKDATLTEYSAEVAGTAMRTRSVMIQDGTSVVAVTSVYMDKTKMAEDRRISEAIEKSLTLK
ncbi:MAG: photosystem II reaction center PsbP family protein [Synergistaceae bacterium]|jgi:hypothetical protein|nr:photosystem II reaction center PsbP family protein [Synergistaceae bacterium]